MKKFLLADTLAQRNVLSVGKIIMLFLMGITLLSNLFLSRISSQDEPEVTVNDTDSPDMLAYVSAEDNLMLYDPRDRTETMLLDNVGSFVMSRNGRIAFTKRDGDDSELYVFNSSTPEIAPINISQNPDEIVYPLRWSPDGRYLAFASFREGSGYSDDIWIAFGNYIASSSDQSLYVWDGETTTNIMPDNTLDTANVFFIDWSYDGRLAFTVQHGWSEGDIPSEIYVWDGSTTTNLSQNPEFWDGVASWNRNGQLLFASQRDDENGIYVWDGVSFRDGSPDVDSFIRVAPELQLTDASWTDEGFVAFTVYEDTGEKEIIVWNLETQAIVRRIPVSSEDSLSWLAEGGQVILSSHLASGLPSYYLDVENTEGEILFSAHTGEISWSADGFLAYCEYGEDRNWTLFIWNGEETWGVATVSYKPAQWQNVGNTFSCNNG